MKSRKRVIKSILESNSIIHKISEYASRIDDNDGVVILYNNDDTISLYKLRGYSELKEYDVIDSEMFIYRRFEHYMNECTIMEHIPQVIKFFENELGIEVKLEMDSDLFNTFYGMLSVK